MYFISKYIIIEILIPVRIPIIKMEKIYIIFDKVNFII